MKKKLIYIGCLAVLCLLASCASRKSFVYLNDMEQGERYLYDAKYEATVHKNDRLAITVSCKQPELAIPFNAHGSNVSVSSDGNVSTSGSSKGYRVDADGNIDFPILGKLQVEGLRVSQVTDMIRQRIIEGNYIKDPQVSLEFLNFKYTVLGAVNGKGTFSVNDDRITLLEAIANAGDLAQNAKLDAINVIREVDGHREVYVHDIRSKELFTSPCFYLQQNDIVYVEPKYKKSDNEDRAFKYGSTLLSIASVIISLFWVLK